MSELEQYPDKYGSFGYLRDATAPLDREPNDATQYLNEWHSKGYTGNYVPEALREEEDEFDNAVEEGEEVDVEGPPEDWTEETERAARAAHADAETLFTDSRGDWDWEPQDDVLAWVTEDLISSYQKILEDRLGYLLDDDNLEEHEGPQPHVSPRESLLDEAKQIIMGDRNSTYGPPTQDFQRSADAMTAMGYRSASGPIRAHDVAILVTLVKISRLQWSPEKRDHWTDIAGYAGCGWECVENE